MIMIKPTSRELDSGSRDCVAIHFIVISNEVRNLNGYETVKDISLWSI